MGFTASTMLDQSQSTTVTKLKVETDKCSPTLYFTGYIAHGSHDFAVFMKLNFSKEWCSKPNRNSPVYTHRLCIYKQGNAVGVSGTTILPFTAMMISHDDVTRPPLPWLDETFRQGLPEGTCWIKVPLHVCSMEFIYRPWKMSAG